MHAINKKRGRDFEEGWREDMKAWRNEREGRNVEIKLQSQKKLVIF